MNRFQLLVYFTISFAIVNAQEPHFIQHDIGDVIAGVAINRMLQDHQSMIWLGTDQGLARYDGTHLHEVEMDDVSLPGKVTSLMEDNKGIIWIGTASGRIFYLDASRKIHAFDIEEGNPAKPITSMLEDPYGHIWFATYGEGVYVYTGQRLFNFGKDDGLSGSDIYAMAAGPAGEIWLGTDDGINICTFKNETKSVRSFGLKDGLPDQIITALNTDLHGRIWIGTFEHGLVYFDPAQKKVIRPFINQTIDEITSIEIFNGSEVWFGTRKTGLWRYHPDSEFERQLVSFNDAYQGEITDVMTDVEGNIWVAMEEGVLLSAFRPFESIKTNVGEIQALFSDHDDQLWIGSKTGLYRLEENIDQSSSIIRVAAQYNFNITDIVEDRFQNLWLGTLDNGLYIYHAASGKIKHVSPDILGGSTIMSMASSKQELWIATLQGVISYPAEKNILLDNNIDFNLVSDPWQSNLHFVFQVFVDSKERVWFATDGNGVYSMDGDKVTQHTGNDSILIRTVYSICEDQLGHLWFNTSDIGLIEYDGQNYKPLALAEGLGNMHVASLAKTGTGDIVIAHQRGIDVLEPARRHMMYYTDEVGVKEMDPGLNSVAVTSKGHVYLSGRDMIVKYYSVTNELSIHPHTQLTRVSVFEQAVDFASKAKFGYDENYIIFEYVGLWYTSPSDVNYLYKLDGYDLHWKESKDNSASYSSLPPGEYTFYVKASENKFFLDEPMASYSFVIAKPFWQQYWFMGGVIILVAAVFYFIVKARERRSKRQAMIQKDMIESQLQALKAQINPHFLFNSFNTLITIIDENTNNPNIAIEYVEKLSDFFRSILQYREQETISLAEELELVQNFGYLLQKRYDTNLKLHLEKAPKEAYILPLTLQMLVENAVKHNIISEHRPLDVFISIDDGYVTVKNNLQPKSKTEPSTQFGLQSIIRRYNLLSDKKIIIENDNDFFTVQIPIIKQTSE